MSYTDRIREARKAKGLTQAQLGQLIGCAKNTVSSYENGTNEPSVAILNKIMSALDVDANYIFQDETAVHRKAHVSQDEMDFLVIPFRSLDAAGQKMVRTVLELESSRCAQEKALQNSCT